MLCWSIFLDFFIYLTFISIYKILIFGIAFQNSQSLFKGAVSSFGVMCKEIAHLIQNSLLYLPAKCQGRATAWTRVISKFQWLVKMGNYFCVLTFMTFLCAHGVLKSLLSGWWSRYTRLHACIECLHWDLSVHCSFFRWGGGSYRQASFRTLRLGIDFRLFVVNLVNLVSVYVFCSDT